MILPRVPPCSDVSFIKGNGDDITGNAVGGDPDFDSDDDNKDDDDDGDAVGKGDEEDINFLSFVVATLSTSSSFTLYSSSQHTLSIFRIKLLSVLIPQEKKSNIIKSLTPPLGRISYLRGFIENIFLELTFLLLKEKNRVRGEITEEKYICCVFYSFSLSIFKLFYTKRDIKKMTCLSECITAFLRKKQEKIDYYLEKALTVSYFFFIYG